MSKPMRWTEGNFLTMLALIGFKPTDPLAGISTAWSVGGLHEHTVFEVLMQHEAAGLDVMVERTFSKLDKTQPVRAKYVLQSYIPNNREDGCITVEYSGRGRRKIYRDCIQLLQEANRET